MSFNKDLYICPLVSSLDIPAIITHSKNNVQNSSLAFRSVFNFPLLLLWRSFLDDISYTQTNFSNNHIKVKMLLFGKYKPRPTRE